MFNSGINYPTTFSGGIRRFRYYPGIIEKGDEHQPQKPHGELHKTRFLIPFGYILVPVGTLWVPFGSLCAPCWLLWDPTWRLWDPTWPLWGLPWTPLGFQLVPLEAKGAKGPKGFMAKGPKSRRAQAEGPRDRRHKGQRAKGRRA